jgi:hypothetical protein
VQNGIFCRVDYLLANARRSSAPGHDKNDSGSNRDVYDDNTQGT